jgi:hypothetical protein
MKTILLASAGALALCVSLSTSAMAQYAGTVSGSYAGDTNDNGADLWNVNGSLTGLFDPNWGAEVTGGYHSLSQDGIAENLDVWNVGGSLFWNNVQGRLAATVNYYDTSIAHLDLNATSYGIGGEYYAAPNFTVAVKGGGETVDVSGFGSSGDDSGGYVGGMLQWYAMPNLSLSGSVDYADLAGSHVTSETIKAEWLFSETMPVSIYGGYEHADLGSGGFGLSGDGDLFFVGVKLYMNGANGGTLVDRQRSGSLGYIAETPILGLSTN